MRGVLHGHGVLLPSDNQLYQIFGRRADEIHSFLDQFWTKYRISPRRLLHHRLGIKLIVEKFGEEAWGAAELHIVDDEGRVPETWLDHDAVYPEPHDEAG
jgi:hypothetical protein